jgi:hypothetical protein
MQIPRQDIPYLEFIGLLFGLALALVEMSGWQMNRYLRHGIGIVGVLLAGTCVVLLVGFSGATLRSPVTFRWPIAPPSDTPSASPPIVRSQDSPVAVPPPAYLAELAKLKDENAKLKTDNAKLRNRPIRTIIERPTPLACPSASAFPPPHCADKLDKGDCGDLLRAQALYDSTSDDVIAARTHQSTDEEKQRLNDAVFTQNQATDNLNRTAYRLCYGYAP